MKNIITLISHGFEEIEAITPVDLLRRAGLSVTLVTPDESLSVAGKNNISLLADAFLSSIDPSNFDVLLLPGGPAVFHLRKMKPILELIQSFHQSEKPIAAICAAPLLLKDAGVLSGDFTSHGSTQDELPERLADKPVVVQPKLITSQGPGTAIPFGLSLIKLLTNKATADNIKSSIHYPYEIL